MGVVITVTSKTTLIQLTREDRSSADLVLRHTNVSASSHQRHSLTFSLSDRVSQDISPFGLLASLVYCSSQKVPHTEFLDGRSWVLLIRKPPCLRPTSRRFLRKPPNYIRI